MTLEVVLGYTLRLLSKYFKKEKKEGRKEKIKTKKILWFYVSGFC